MRLFSFNTPNTPPTAKEDDLTFLRLVRSRRVGPASFYKLTHQHGSVSDALAALPEVARAAGLSDYAPCPEDRAAAELRAGAKAGARFLRCDDPDYPALLRDLPDAPPALWVKGNLAALSRPPLAMIGARNASSLGLRMARGMAGALAEEGNTIVSGLARGIDTAAHEASQKWGTIAVLAGGIDVIYPRDNTLLAATLCENGLLISEQPPGLSPVARHFPMRNRIISGLSQAVVVVEAALKSGSLITARMALDQGREVMAVPGHPIDARASGCNALIRDGATLVRNAQDVIEALPEPAQGLAMLGSAETPSRTAMPDGAEVARQSPTESPAYPAKLSAVPSPQTDRQPASIEQRILARLGPSPTDENQVIRDVGLPAAQISPVILALELEGKLTRMRGGKIALM